MDKNIKTLIVQAEQFIVMHGYSKLTIKEYKSAWNKVLSLCEEWGLTSSYGSDVEDMVLTKFGINRYDELTDNGKMKIRAVRCLLTIEQEEIMPAAVGHGYTYKVPEYFFWVLDDYREELISRGLKHNTVIGSLIHVKALLSSVDVKSIEKLTVDEVKKFASLFSGKNPQTHAGRLYTIRSFLCYAVKKYGCNPALASLFPVIPGYKHYRLALSYTKEEVRSALEASYPPASSLRNTTMLTIAAQMGMRIGDIKALKFENIDWINEQFVFKQSKTGLPQMLPMTDEVRYLLIDYLANERPSSDDANIFLSERAPLRSFANLDNSFHYVASSAYERGGVDFKERHHGMHSLRHSLAARMLSDGAPLPVITGVLGHTSSNTTRRYLEIDINQLRDLALEVPNE